MQEWRDQAYILNARGHGEGGAVVALLTESHGRHAGYLPGGQSGKKRGLLQPGSAVEASWRARVEDQLGTLSLEPLHGLPYGVLEAPLKLAALQSACALCEAALPEREGHPGLFHGFAALMRTLESEIWGEAYILWEIAFLKELGFGLDLTRCALGGARSDLSHVSPKSGRAVAAGRAGPYLDRLLPLPDFLKPAPAGTAEPDAEILLGLALTGHFLEHWAFAHHSQGVPAARLRLAALYAKKCEARDRPAGADCA